ncbi:dipeptidase [Bacteroidota bacterium]
MKKNLLKKTSLLLTFIVLFVTQFSFAQLIPVAEEDASCTSIMVGKKATTDGSVITSHSCDGGYRTWLNIVPHKKHAPGTMRKIYWGTMHTETSWDVRNMVVKGEIPEVEETYSYFNVCYPAMNEKQLAIGETTIGGKRDLRNDDGLFVIEQLQAIALERCTNARDAIKLMGDLAVKYGYGDSGECLTVADKNEVWHFEIMGSGVMEVSAVWAAVRIPDNHVGVSANIPRISTLDLDNPDYYMASENVFSLAEELEFWDPKGDEPFRWWKAYSGRKPYSTREFYILSTMAPSLNLTDDMEELPFSVKPDEKVDIRDVMRYYRETYEGTEFDATQNLLVAQSRYRGRGANDANDDNVEKKVKSPIVNPWINSYLASLLNELKPGTVQRNRTIAITGCSYSQIIQCRDWLPDEIGGIAWFSFDNPGQSPRIPVYSGTLFLPESFKIGGQHRYRTDAALWHFRRANRLSQVRWGSAGPILNKAIMEFENQALTEIPLIDNMAVELYNKEKGKEPELDARGNPEPAEYREFLTKYTNDFARSAMNKWWELGDQFWGMFGRGF